MFAEQRCTQMHRRRMRRETDVDSNVDLFSLRRSDGTGACSEMWRLGEC